MSGLAKRFSAATAVLRLRVRQRQIDKQISTTNVRHSPLNAHEPSTRPRHRRSLFLARDLAASDWQRDLRGNGPERVHGCGERGGGGHAVHHEHAPIEIQPPVRKRLAERVLQGAQRSVLGDIRSAARRVRPDGTGRRRAGRGLILDQIVAHQPRILMLQHVAVIKEQAGIVLEPEQYSHALSRHDQHGVLPSSVEVAG